MVADALKIGQHIRPYKADLDAAQPLLHAQNMAGTQLLLEAVYDLLKRLDLCGNDGIILRECADCKVKRLAYCGGDHVVFAQRGLGQGQVLLTQLLRRAENIDRMVGDALKVTDGFKYRGRLLAFRAAHLSRADLDEIAA